MKKEQQIDFYSNEVLKSYNLEEKMRYQLSILDSLDVFTRKHSENVASLTARLCKKMNLEEGFSIYCTICAFLHDIGKAYIPPSILQKPGKLTDEEYEIMKTHTQIGYEILHKDPELRPYEAGAWYHHEALDGSGYPRGLKGNDIVYEGQIIRVADEFDAITSKRQYKTHIGVNDTLKILIENTKPKDNVKRGLFKINYGKTNRQIVNALIKLIIEDTEYEIYQRELYIEHLQNEKKRYIQAEKVYNKYLKTNNENKKEYLKEYINGFLITGESFREIPQYISDVNQILENKLELLKKLKEEFKQMKKLKA